MLSIHIHKIYHNFLPYITHSFIFELLDSSRNSLTEVIYNSSISFLRYVLANQKKTLLGIDPEKRLRVIMMVVMIMILMVVVAVVVV